VSLRPAGRPPHPARCLKISGAATAVIPRFEHLWALPGGRTTKYQLPVCVVPEIFAPGRGCAEVLFGAAVGAEAAGAIARYPANRPTLCLSTNSLFAAGTCG